MKPQSAIVPVAEAEITHAMKCADVQATIALTNDDVAVTQAAITDNGAASIEPERPDSAPIVDRQQDEIKSIDTISSDSRSLTVAEDVAVVADAAEADSSMSQPPVPHHDETASSDESIAIVPSQYKPGDYVQWESNGVLRMPAEKRLSHFSDDGNFAFIEGSATGIPVAELIAADPLPSSGETEIALEAVAIDAERTIETEGAAIQESEALESEVASAPNVQEDSAHGPKSDAAASGGNDSSSGAPGVGKDCLELTPDNHGPSATDAALAVIEQANGIDRNPVNSVIEYIERKEFSQTRLDQLYARWDQRDSGFWVEYGVRCEIVYEIHEETVKPGCNGGFSAALRRIKLAASTAYDMIARHKISIGEMEDPDAYDTRDDEEEGEKADGEEDEEQGENEDESTGTGSNRGGANGRKKRPKTAVITLSGPIAEAVAAIQNYYHKANAKEVIKFCVLRVWSDLKMPLANRTEDPAESVAAAISKPKRTKLILDDDFLEETASTGDHKSATADLPPHIPNPSETGGLSGVA